MMKGKNSGKQQTGNIKIKMNILVSMVMPFFITSIFVFHGCTNLSEPVKVNLNITGLQRNNTAINYLSFHKAVVSIREIKFFGAREVGSAIFFTTNPTVPGNIYSFTTQQPVFYIRSFDIPQGVYSQMRWEITSGEVDDETYENEYFDIDDFGIIFEGTYTRLDGLEVLLFIVIDPFDVYLFETFTVDGKNSISVSADNIYGINLKLNPYLAMQNIERELLEYASSGFEEVEDYIEISSFENSLIYERMLLRLKQTIQSTIQDN